MLFMNLYSAKSFVDRVLHKVYRGRRLQTVGYILWSRSLLVRGIVATAPLYYDRILCDSLGGASVLRRHVQRFSTR